MKPAAAVVLAWLMVMATWTCCAGQPLRGYIIAHSHCDPGWRVTLEQYYEQQVRHILDNTVQSVSRDPSRQFIWAEIVFFSMWYQQQNETVRAQLKRLIDNNQWEFVHGGWVMEDEASADPLSRINQITVGHEYLVENFGSKPRYGWQIDPFGGSSITPGLFKALGYNALVHDRISLRIKNQRMTTKELQFIWEGSVNLGESSELFTHVLDNWYWQPSGYNWDEGDPPVTDSNIKQLADNLASILHDRADYFRTNHVLYPFGHDFAFQDAEIMFENMDKLIDYINERNTSYNLIVSYGKLSDYFNDVNQAVQEWPRFEMDYLPFEDNPWSVGSCFWVGHFTSRPHLKYLSRKTDATLKAAETAFVFGKHDDFSLIQHGREIAGLMNHHDAITGTSKQVVIDDYMDKMRNALSSLHTSLAESLSAIFAKEKLPAFSVLNFDGESIMEQDELGEVLVLQNLVPTPVVVWNSLGWERDEVISVRVQLSGVTPGTSLGRVTVVDENQRPIASQLIETWLTSNVEYVNAHLYWHITVPALGARVYFLTYDSAYPSDTQISYPACGAGFSISSTFVSIDFSADNLMETIHDLHHSTQLRINQNFLEYTTVESGAYLFTPLGSAIPLFDLSSLNTSHLVPPAFSRSEKIRNCPIVRLSQGPLVQSVEQLFPENLRQTIRIYNNFNSSSSIPFFRGVDLKVNVDGPLSENRELIMRFNTEIANFGRYYTDNGMEMVTRDYDDTWEDKIPSNYRPIITTVLIKDQDQSNSRSVAVISAQSHGVASLESGQLELMLQRRLMQDDNLGMEEAMNELDPCMARFFLLVNSDPGQEAEHVIFRHTLQQIRNNPITLLASAELLNPTQWAAAYQTKFAPAAEPFPPNVHLASLQMRNSHDQTVVIRLAHMYEKNDAHWDLSLPVVVDLDQIFPGIDLSDLEERSLSLRDSLEEQRKQMMVWNNNEIDTKEIKGANSSQVVLNPIQIRSFFTNFHLRK